MNKLLAKFVVFLLLSITALNAEENYLNIDGEEWSGPSELHSVDRIEELKEFCNVNTIEWESPDNDYRCVFYFDGHIAYCFEYITGSSPKVAIIQ